MSKIEIIPKILEILQRQAESTANLFDIFTSNYGESYRKMRRTVKYGVPQFRTDWAFEYKKAQQFYSLLNKLKNQGLIGKRANRNKSRGGSIWKITKKGLEKLKLIKTKKMFAKNSVDYKKERDNKIKVVIFDIPEKQRYKRNWLRVI